MRKDRALLASLPLLILMLGAYWLRNSCGAEWWPGCLFRKLTGFECPGCGMTRAAHALLNGRIAEAFAFNPVGMILLPVALIAIGLEVIGWVREKPQPIRILTGRWGSSIAALVLITWWIGRNLF